MLVERRRGRPRPLPHWLQSCRTDVFLMDLEEDEYTATRDPSFYDLYGAHGEYEDDYKIQMKNKVKEDK